MASISEIVQINVGGRMFQSLQSTFAKAGFLANLFSEDMGGDSVDTNGCVFLDRDPELFEEVLRLLRGYSFESHPRLNWDAIKSEADFYLVLPELITEHAPEPEIALPPEMISIETLRFRIERTKKSCHWIPTTDEYQLPLDVQAKMYTAGIHGRAVPPVALKELGFKKVDENFEIYERKIRTIYYLKPKGGEVEIPSHKNEVDRHESSCWTWVAYAIFE
jgi:hypothetical protein